MIRCLLAMLLVFNFGARVDASSEVLDASQTLRKASLHLRQRLPQASEYRNLEACPSKEECLRQRIRSYLQNEAFVRSLRLKLFEWIRFENDPIAPGSLSSAQLLAEKILRENRPWDELWTSSDYRFYESPSPDFVFQIAPGIFSDRDFFNPSKKEHPSPFRGPSSRCLVLSFRPFK